MILYYDEFKEISGHSASMLSILKKDEKEFLHKMDIEKIKEFLGSEGRRGYTSKKAAILDYLQWLYNTYKIDVIELNYDITNILPENIDFKEVYFYSLEDMLRGVSTSIEKATVEYESDGKNIDFEGFKVFCLLQWCGVTIEEFVSIGLHDVKDNKVFIPLSNRVIVIDNRIADIISEYQKKDSSIQYDKQGTLKTKPYKQNTLYRSIKAVDITPKSIFNIRSKFASVCDDKRFAKNRIYNSGRYYEMLKLEEQLHRELELNDKDLINQTFNHDINTHIWVTLADFKEYKESRALWVSSQNHIN